MPTHDSDVDLKQQSAGEQSLVCDPWDVAHAGLPTATGVAPVDDSLDSHHGSESREHADIHNADISLPKLRSVHTNPTPLCHEQADDAEYFNTDQTTTHTRRCDTPTPTKSQHSHQFLVWGHHFLFTQSTQRSSSTCRYLTLFQLATVSTWRFPAPRF